MKQKLRKTLSLTLLILSLTSCQTYVVYTQETPNSQTTIVETQEVKQESKTQKSKSRETLKKNTKKTTSATTEKIKENVREVKETKQTTKASKTTVKETSTEIKQTTVKETKSIEEVAKDVLNGKYGNGEQRRVQLKKEGYNYNEVQTAVEKLIPTPTQPRQTQAQQNSTTSRVKLSITMLHLA